MTDCVVIGFGNDLRSDDRVGRLAAERVEALALPGVEVRVQSQLTPELAELIAGRRLVVFVDADIDAPDVKVEPVSGRSPGGSVMAHHGDPADLVAMSGTVGEPPVEALVVSIPATNLEMGFELSPKTAAGLERAVELIAGLVAQPAAGKGPALG